jgi:hypothetical protein
LNHVQRDPTADHFLLFPVLGPARAVLNNRRDFGLVQQFVDLPIVGRLVIRQGPDAPLRQVRLGLFDQGADALVVARLRVGDVVPQYHLVGDIDDQVQLVTEPLDHRGDIPLGIVVLLAPAAGLGQTVRNLGLTAWTRPPWTAGCFRLRLAVLAGRVVGLVIGGTNSGAP